MEELKKYREFTVTPGICGFKVKIGCAEAYFSDVPSLHEAICRYLDDPVGAEEAYRKGDLRWGGVECAGHTGHEQESENVGGANRPAGHDSEASRISEAASRLLPDPIGGRFKVTL